MNHVTNINPSNEKWSTFSRMYIKSLIILNDICFIFIGQAILKYAVYSVSTNIASISSNIILINIIFTAYEINTAVSDLLPRKARFAHNLMQELLLDKHLIKKKKKNKEI